VVAIRSSDPVPATNEIELLRENHTIADLLDEIAHLLEDQQASDFRVRAYRQAADTVRTMVQPIRSILLEEGIPGLVALPAIGQSIASLIEQYVRLRRMPLLDRLRGEITAEHFFTTLPGIGPELSHRIHDYLHVETLPELDAAVRQGRLDQVPGLGRKRIRAIRETLAQRLRSKSDVTAKTFPEVDRSVPVAELLDIDEEYRGLAKQNRLPKIAPSKFNPGRLAWLPILHTVRDDRHYTALFSNTARAHELNTTKDWVVIYRDDVKSHGRWTVITSQFGKLSGCRIVRGREEECREHYHHS